MFLMKSILFYEVDRKCYRYYDGETYVLYRKYYEGINMLQFEDVMTPASKKRIERREYNTSVS
jgi:poly(glycerol-phosphate) alpha-glucosyltransferase